MKKFISVLLVAVIAFTIIGVTGITGIPRYAVLFIAGIICGSID